MNAARLRLDVVTIAGINKEPLDQGGPIQCFSIDTRSCSLHRGEQSCEKAIPHVEGVTTSRGARDHPCYCESQVPAFVLAVCVEPCAETGLWWEDVMGTKACDVQTNPVLSGSSVFTV